ncbi:5-formyltetrahydrofolate cyclo-ligase [Thalassospira sp. TSL5-1]|uniref:5-formyltetrahydrofolate cyclo-ligase n=1 Tax=Thalassospira sp. TSL5-1 TaxID=1544451 RepID=UPI000A5C8FF9|nr:5-formyltetrahydrofolate cyclo-ligase [Thalassospira sp. TSL5-1]
MKNSDKTDGRPTPDANRPGSPLSTGFAMPPDFSELVKSPPADARHVADWRKQVRQALLAVRQDMSETARSAAQAEICRKLDAVLISRIVPKKACVGFYWPVQGEIDVRDVIADHVRRGGGAALPVVIARHQPMVFCRWAPGCEMTTGFAGIDIPAKLEQVVPDVILAPLVGFDQQGYRLGYGGGFFDRTLAALKTKPVVIGIGLAHAGLPSIFPHPFDVPMDILITEEAVRHFSSFPPS